MIQCPCPFRRGARRPRGHFRSGRRAASAVGLLLLLAGAPAAAADAVDAAAAPPEVPADDERGQGPVWRWSWDRGIRYDLELPFEEYWFGPDSGPLTDKPFEKRLALIGRIGAIVQVDGAGYAQTRGLKGADSGIDLRRFRFGTRGDFYLLRHLSYAVDLELVGTNLQVGDVYLWWEELPIVGGLKIGNFTPPLSLESVTSARDTIFMETALPVLAFAPGRSAGVQIGGPAYDGRLTWAFGSFRTLETPTDGDQSQDGGRSTGRLTWLADDDRTGRRLTHLGVSGSVLFAAQDVRYRARPESHLAPTFVDTGVLRSARYTGVSGLEVARIQGPWTLMSEALLARVSDEDSAILWGLYLSMARFLSDDSQPYDRTSGRLGRFDPPQPFSWSRRTWGALRAAARLSYLDLTGGAIDGGRETNVTGDLTWFLDHYLSLRLEAGFAAVRQRPDDGNLFFVQSRFQFDFY